MSDPMNEIAKALASDMPRRKVFKLALGGVAASIGATVAGAVKPLVARANFSRQTGIAVKPASGYFGGTADLSATLVDLSVNAVNPHPINGQPLEFFLFNYDVGSSVTNINGMASISGVNLLGINAGTYFNSVRVNYAGNYYLNYAPSHNYGTLVINPAPTMLAVNQAYGLYGGATDLSATLTAYINAGYQPVFNQAIEFFLLNQDAGSTFTNVNGVAGLTNVSLSGIDPGVYMNGVAANYEAGGNYAPAYGTNTLTVLRTHIVVPLYNQSAGFRWPYWAVIRLYVADDEGHNVSSRLLTVTSVELTREGDPGIPFAYRFTFDSRLTRGGGYQLLINTRYLKLGTYTLSLRVDDDPTLYSVQFVLY